MNLESNIYVANQENATNYFIYEFYNPASTKGGFLYKTKVGYFSLKEYSMDRIDNRKFWKRRNLTGVTFNTPIVVRFVFFNM